MRITVGEFIDKEEWGDIIGSHCIYVVRDGDVIFYVGKSDAIIERLWGHLGTEIHGSWPQFGRRASDLGRLIRANLPQSRNWHIDLLTLEDCQSYTVFQVPITNIDTAEAGLIQMLGPSLNRELNSRNRDGRLSAYITPWKIPTDLWPDFD